MLHHLIQMFKFRAVCRGALIAEIPLPRRYWKRRRLSWVRARVALSMMSRRSSSLAWR